MPVMNDLTGAIEVDGQVLYPSRSLDVHGSVTVRLRDAPHIQGRGQGHRLSAAKDFGDFGRDARKWLLAEAQAVKREARRRQEQKKRMELQAAQEANLKVRGEDKGRNFAAKLIAVTCCLYLPVVLLLLMALAQPVDAALAALLACGVLLLSCCLSLLVPTFGRPAGWSVDAPGWELSWACAAWFAGALACACVTLMSVQHALIGYWWTSLIIWPCSCCSIAFSFAVGMTDRDDITRKERIALTAAQVDVLTRSIVFHGEVIEEPGRPCVASWPGKYEAAWDRLVQSSREGETSAAVVFLPQGTPSYGEHAPIPAEEDIAGECWCIPIYGERKPWGCLWWDKWIKNIEKAHACGAKLEVYYFEKSVGAGKVKSFDTAGDEHLRRDKINSRRTAFQQSDIFKAAVAAGLDKLSKGTGRDSSSQYSREYHRLFLSWLPSEDRDFILASEGLGNSQKAEVAWLDRKGYEHVEVDVSKWLEESLEEYHVPVSHGVTPKAHQEGCEVNPQIPGRVEAG